MVLPLVSEGLSWCKCQVTSAPSGITQVVAHIPTESARLIYKSVLPYFN